MSTDSITSSEGHPGEHQTEPLLEKTPQEMRTAIQAFLNKTAGLFLREDRHLIARGAFLAQDRGVLNANNDSERQMVLREILREISEAPESNGPAPRENSEPRLVLSKDERVVLKWETKNMIKQSGMLVWLILCCSLGAATQGMNEESRSSRTLGALAN